MTEDATETNRRELNQFFELTPDEKEKTLNTLSDAERAADGKNPAGV